MEFEPMSIAVDKLTMSGITRVKPPSKEMMLNLAEMGQDLRFWIYGPALTGTSWWYVAEEQVGNLARRSKGEGLMEGRT